MATLTLPETALPTLPDLVSAETPYDVFKARRADFAQALRGPEFRQVYRQLHGDSAEFCFVGLGAHLRRR